MRKIFTFAAALAIAGVLTGSAWADDAAAKPKKNKAGAAKKENAEKESLTPEQKKAKHQEAMKTRFGKLDADGNASLSIEEFTAKLPKDPAKAETAKEKLTKRFATLDANGDKPLSLEEYTTPPKRDKSDKPAKAKKNAATEK